MVGRLIVRMKGLSYGQDGVTKTEARKAYISGFMPRARKHKKFYQERGIKKFKFVHGKFSTTKKL